jgi:hypothetical protein
MKKISLLIALAVFAAAPAAAASKKNPEHKNPQQMTFDEAMAQNQKNLSLVVQGLPLILPSWSLPIYFKVQESADQPQHGKKKH